jgi:dnd system-associated protein 4
MSVYVNPKFRIKRNAIHQEMMQKLTSGFKIFEGYRDILVLSAVIGSVNSSYVPIKKVASDGVLMQFFNENDYDLIDLIAYSHEKDQSILKSDEKYEIFSSYANGGFPILLDVLNITQDTNIDEAMREKILTKIYASLLSNQFKVDSAANDLLIT